MANADLFLKLNVAYNTDIDKLEKVLNSLKKDIKVKELKLSL